MENPLEAFGKLNDKQKMMVVGGAGGLGLLLYLHSKKQAADTSATSDATPTQGASYDDQGGAFTGGNAGGSYGGGYGGYEGAVAPPTVTSANDGTTPEAPIVNVAAPDLSPIADAISSLGAGDTGGGAPVTDSSKHAAPKKTSSFKTITVKNKKTGTTQTVHDYAGSHPDVVVGAHPTAHKAAAKKPAPKKHTTKTARKHVNHK